MSSEGPIRRMPHRIAADIEPVSLASRHARAQMMQSAGEVGNT